MASPQRENGFTAISNELFEVVVRTPLPGRHKDLLLYVMRKTYGYQKKKDYISLSQFEDGTGIDRSGVCKIIKDLVAWKLLAKEGSIYALNKDYSTWLVAQRPLKVVVPTPLVGSGAHATYKRKNTKKEEIVANATPYSKNPKNMKKNRLGSYKESNSEDAYEEVIDLESGERTSTAPKYDFSEQLKRLRNSPKKVDKIIAHYWTRKGFKFENEAQAKAQYGMDSSYAKNLKGYTGEQLDSVMDVCEADAKKLGYEWNLNTVMKKAASTIYAQ